MAAEKNLKEKESSTTWSLRHKTQLYVSINTSQFCFSDMDRFRASSFVLCAWNFARLMMKPREEEEVEVYKLCLL